MMSRAGPLWWTLARSEEVTDKKPLAVDIGDQPVVLWRDKQGIARALEDRCPHRRAPLSLGCIRDNGWIQCGYHGWSYEGETGRLKEIPNMKDDQRFPPIYKAAPFAVEESGGFVRICLDAKAAAPAPVAHVKPLSGTAHVALEQSHWLDALYDNPGLVIDIKGVDFTSYPASELREENGFFVMERSCLWGKLHWPSFTISDFPITLLSRTNPDTGESDLTLRDDAFNTLLDVSLAPVPAARGVTQVRWRAELGKTLNGRHAARLRRGTPFAVRETIDAAALRVLKPSVSLHGRKLRDEITMAPAIADAA
jgi:hypothetical protein